MIINPSAHTMIPRRNSFRNHTGSRRYRGVTLPGGKRLWFGVAKVLLASALFLFISSALHNGSVERLTTEIENLEASHGELVAANILLRANPSRNHPRKRPVHHVVPGRTPARVKADDGRTKRDIKGLL